MVTQLVFDFVGSPAHGVGDFYVSDANAAAVEAIQTWHDWPQGKLVLCGPAGAGKTHLAHIWAAMTGAQHLTTRIVAAPALHAQDMTKLTRLAEGNLVVEDVDRIAGDETAEQALFHLHNLVLAEGGALLLTARVPPARWDMGLPDLVSRMQGTALASVAPPDDDLLAAVMIKLFADRQIEVDPSVVTYLTRRIDRSFADIGAVVAALDDAALAAKRPVTRPLAAEVLDKLAANRA